MNIAVILENFRYFLSFPDSLKQDRFYFYTIHEKFSGSAGTVSVCSARLEPPSSASGGSAEWPEYFKVQSRLGLLSPRIDYAAAAGIYESFFNRHLSQQKIDLLVSGCTTGFERCGIACAKRMGIGVLCVWEGFFRPDTISHDTAGMNAESAFYASGFDAIMEGPVSRSSLEFIRAYQRTLKKVSAAAGTLHDIHGEKFDVLHQLKNRWNDRRQMDRIRLPIAQHLSGRLSFWRDLYSYARTDALQRPFIFFPLQTHTDSNIAINSDLLPYEQCVRRVIDAFGKSEIRHSHTLVIKEHPFDVFRMPYRRETGNSILWLRPETPVSRIINHPHFRGTVTVNSTAGFETLLAGKPVVALGRSMYAWKELVTIPQSLEREDISAALEVFGERKVDNETIVEYSARLFEKTQIQGNLGRAPLQHEIEAFEGLMRSATR